MNKHAAFPGSAAGVLLLALLPAGPACAGTDLADLRHAQRWPELKAAAQAALNVDAGDPDAIAAMVDALWHEGRAPQALAIAATARARGHDSAALRLAEAGAWSLLGRWSDVTHTLAPDLPGGDPEVLLLVALALREQGRLEEARPILVTLTRRRPADRRAWINLARLELQAGQAAAAIAALRQLPAPADTPEALLLTARAQRLGRDPAAAVATVTRALAAAPERASLYALRAQALADLQSWPEAARDIHTALQLGARAAADYLLACESARQLGDTEALAGYARAGLAAHPQQAEFALQLAHALRELGRLEEADGLLARAQAGFPDDASLALEHALVQMALGRNDAVVATLDPVLARRPGAEAYALRGYAWLRRGEPVRAGEDAGNALALEPGHPTALLVQARVALAEGRPERAEAPCRQALARAPALAWANTTCGEVALAQGRADAARALADRALQLSPQDAEALALRDKLRQRATGSPP